MAVGVRKGPGGGIGYVDVSTGEFRVTEVDAADVLSALEQINARELLLPLDATSLDPAGRQVCQTPVEGWIFAFDYADQSLREHFRLHSLDGCGLANRALPVGAARAILHSLRDTQRSTLDHLERPAYYERADALILDAATVRNL